jgi:HK97 family phage prohead protease
MALNVDYLPNVRDLAPALDGDALVVSGYAATLDLDRVGDRFDRTALADALGTYLTTNPVVLYAHDKGKPPIGKVIEARVDDKGLFVKALLPRPAGGSWAEGIWHAARQGLLRAFSVGGRWYRQAAQGYQRIVRADLHEISLAPVAVNGMAFASDVQQVQHVKALADGRIVPVVQRVDPVELARARMGVHDLLRDIGALRTEVERERLRDLARR